MGEYLMTPKVELDMLKTPSLSKLNSSKEDIANEMKELMEDKSKPLKLTA